MDIDSIRSQFSFLQQTPTPVYLDNAATTQLPNLVIDAISDHYRFHNANVGRGNHKLTIEATRRYSQVRKQVAHFINAPDEREIIFTSNTTASINLAADILGHGFLNPGDTILLTQMEHHSNLTPWIEVAKKNNAHLAYIPLTPEGDLDLDRALPTLEGKKVKILALTQISNVLGTINDVKGTIKRLTELFPELISVIDVAQSVGHTKVDVVDMGCDFVSFSAHKMYGPQGVGVLWGKYEHLEKAVSPTIGGGSVSDASWFEYTPGLPPARYEAGTPNVAGVVGLGAAIDFITLLGVKKIHWHEQDLRKYLLEKLSHIDVDGLKLYGLTATESRSYRSQSSLQDDNSNYPNNQNHPNPFTRSGILSLSVNGVDPHDLATYLDEDNIMVRSGTHCTIPLQRDILHVNTTLRVSIGVYNTKQEIDTFVESLQKAVEFLS